MQNYNLGNLKGKGSSTRRFGFCQKNNPQPWTCFDQFLGTTSLRTIDPIPLQSSPLPNPGKMKAVFLLNLTTTTNFSIKNTLNYYWQNYPQEFTECPIVDNEGSVEITLRLLDEYYGYGFKNFVSFQTSTILAGVLESKWFDFHPDAIGISPTANSNSLNIPKSIYRFLPDNSFIINSISKEINNAIDGGYNIYYIYSLFELVCEDALRILNQTIGNYSNYVTLGTIPSDFENPTIIQNFLNSPPNGSISSSDILITLIFDRDEYLNLYDTNLYTTPLTFPGQQYDILASLTPVIPVGSQIALLNKYNVPLFKGINTSILWRNGYNSLGAADFSTVTPNILNILNQFANNLQIDNINSHYGSLIFNPVTKDIEYPSILLEIFKNDGINGYKFYPKDLYIDDAYLGKITANFVTNTPISTNIIPILPNKPFYGKAIGLFDLGYGNKTDYIEYQSLYYFWSKDTSLPKFPTVDITNSTSSQVADLLTSYYNQGYRLFLGPNLGYRISTQDILNWFSLHPDTICLSLLSGVIIQNIPLNIYRLYPQASEIITLLIKKIQTSVKIYYIYDSHDPLGITVNYILQNFSAATRKTYKSFAIVSTPTTNLTVPNMLEFFGINPLSNPVTTSDTNIILTNSNLQNYLDLYIDISMNQIVCPQYIGTGKIDPIIPVPDGGTVLNKNLYSLDITYPSSSYLWNENRLFLTDEYSSNTDSVQILNALKMMQYILSGKDIKLLGSYLGTLQFNPDNSNIIFPSVLIQQYQSTLNKFVNYEINFTDPLLGVFKASFI